MDNDGMKAVKAGYSLEKHVEGESRQLGAPVLRWEFAKEIAELWREERWRPNGHSGKTLVKYPNVRVVLIVMMRGGRLENHEAVARVSIQTLQGHVFVRLSDQRIDLPCGCLLELERLLPHDIEALEESAVLLTLAFAGAARRLRPSQKPRR
jgi:quercetin dioxygenase-like cupin family protein